MSEHILEMPLGEKTIRLNLPDEWNLLRRCDPAQAVPVKDVREEARRALTQPIGCETLAELAAGRKKAVIVADDVSRNTPVYQFIEPVMETLERAGIRDENVTVILSLGVHRPMKHQEIEKKIGREAAGRYKTENHVFDDPDKLTYFGTTTRKTPVWINKKVAEADLVISMGCIEPHVIAGMSGGYKNIVPGVAGQKTVAANHAINTKPATFNMVGRPAEENPMRMDFEEAARMLKPPVFLVNAVLTPRGEITAIVAGDPIQAQREGAKISSRIYGVTIDERADIVITSSHPLNIDLRQGFKCLANTIGAVKPGGTVISLIAAKQGIGDMTIPKRKFPVSKKTVARIAPWILPFVGRFSFGMKEEDRFFVYFALQAIRRSNLIFYAPTIPKEFSDKIPFLDFCADTEELFGKVRRAVPGRATVLAFPHGGASYPILEKGDQNHHPRQ